MQVYEDEQEDSSDNSDLNSGLLFSHGGHWSMPTAGVIGVQGDVTEHVIAIEEAAKKTSTPVDVITIRQSGLVPQCDYLLLPGGESTTISRLLTTEGIDSEITEHAAAGKPILATCAGLIVASTDANDNRVSPLHLLNIEVTRNAFGRQRDSFETHIPVAGLSDPFHAVFIRAPTVSRVGNNVSVLATVDSVPVAVKEGNIVGTAFHPELTGDSRIHRLTFFD